MGFGHKCGLALFQAKNGFLCYPSRYNLHLNQNQHTATQRRAQWRNLGHRASPWGPEPIVCLHWGHIAMKSGWPWKAFTRIKSTTSEVTFALKLSFLTCQTVMLTAPFLQDCCEIEPAPVSTVLRQWSPHSCPSRRPSSSSQAGGVGLGKAEFKASSATYQPRGLPQDVKAHGFWVPSPEKQAWNYSWCRIKRIWQGSILIKQLDT